MQQQVSRATFNKGDLRAVVAGSKHTWGQVASLLSSSGFPKLSVGSKSNVGLGGLVGTVPRCVTSEELLQSYGVPVRRQHGVVTWRLLCSSLLGNILKTGQKQKNNYIGVSR